MFRAHPSIQKINKVIIIGHYGGHNTGDEAMLAGLIKQISVVLQTIVVFSKQVLDVPPLPANVIFHHAQFLTIIKELWNTDALILGGGTHFHDDYTQKRYFRHALYMIKIVLISALARVFRKKVFWLSMGFGPFYRTVTTLITRTGLMFPHLVVTRETASYEEVKSWISSKKLVPGFDLAALMPNLNGSQNKSNQFLLGISVLSIANIRTGYIELDLLFWNLFSEALKKILQEKPIHIRIFVFRGGNREDDHATSLQLYEKLSEIDPTRIELIPHNSDPHWMFERFQECHAVVATRFHSAVFAYLSECRMLLIAYHRKLIDLAKEIKLDEQAIIPITLETSVDQIYNKLTELVTHPKKFYAKLPIEKAIHLAKVNTSKFIAEI